MCVCDGGAVFDRSDLELGAFNNEDKFLLGVIGWGEVLHDDVRWFAQYTQPVSIFEHHPMVRSATLKMSDKYALPIQLIGDSESTLELFESKEIENAD